jgi:hypothetical protein
MSTPRSILSRASTANLTSLAAISVHSVGVLIPGGGTIAGPIEWIAASAS